MSLMGWGNDELSTTMNKNKNKNKMKKMKKMNKKKIKKKKKMKKNEREVDQSSPVKYQILVKWARQICVRDQVSQIQHVRESNMLTCLRRRRTGPGTAL